MNDDMNQFLGLFLDEASEQLELLEQDILKLEQEPSQELLQEIFRAAHTLKGSSRAMGFTSMGELTHAVEDVFDALRHGTLRIHSDLIDALFLGLDAIKEMKDEIAATGTTTLDTTEQTSRLRAALHPPTVLVAEEPFSASPSLPSPSPPGLQAQDSAETAVPFTTKLDASQQMALQDAKAAGYAIFGMILSIAPDCVMKSVRALMVLQALAHVGSVLTTTPSEEALENEAFENDFEIVFATQQEAEVVRATAARVTEIREVRIAPWPAVASPAPSVAPAPEDATLSASPGPGDAAPSGHGRSLELPQTGETEKGGTEKKTPTAPGGAQVQTVRVDVARLDKLLNLVGELVIDRTRIAQLGGQFERHYALNDLVEHLNETAAHIGRITDELQVEIMKARMLPIDNVFNRFPRMVRDLALKLGKEIQFVIEGKETELDRSIIEIIGDPLIHMLRNSVDHGIERPDDRERQGKPRVGTVWLRARHEENYIVIEIQDDGKGLDPNRLRTETVRKGLLTQEEANRLSDKEAINLIFTPGFTTAQVISDVSGRGVGMDIVKSNLQKLGALIDIESRVGVGSTFTVKLPLTLAIIRGLLVTVDQSVYVLPLASVVETIKIAPQSVHLVNHREVILQRGKTLPIIRMQRVFHPEWAAPPAERALEHQRVDIRRRTLGNRASHPPELAVDRAPPEIQPLYLVVVGPADKQVGLVVDALIGEQEIVIKTLGKFIGDIKGISGATILGDGRVALIVDINGLIAVATKEKGRAYASGR